MASFLPPSPPPMLPLATAILSLLLSASPAESRALRSTASSSRSDFRPRVPPPSASALRRRHGPRVSSRLRTQTRTHSCGVEKPGRRDFGQGLMLGLGAVAGSGLWSSLPAEARQMLQSGEMSKVQVFQKSTSSVVFIDTFIQEVYPINQYTMNPIEIPAGTGSGFVWDLEGHIITNFHVIRNAQTARVAIADVEKNSVSSFKANLVGYDPDKDLAVLKVDAPKALLKPLTLGTSNDLLVGQEAIAIGNPFGLDHTLTVGVVSGLGRQVVSPSGRPIFNVIQTDASINPGNSGGPLLNSAGQIIGINTAIYSPSGASSGVGFAIPIDTVKTIVSTLIEKGQILRPQIGISLFDTKALKSLGINIPGVAVLEVARGSPADQAGIVGLSRTDTGELEVGDIIISFDGEPIKDESDIFRCLEKYQPGDTMIVKVQRKKEYVELPLKLGAAKRQDIALAGSPAQAPASNSGITG